MTANFTQLGQPLGSGIGGACSLASIVLRERVLRNPLSEDIVRTIDSERYAQIGKTKDSLDHHTGTGFVCQTDSLEIENYWQAMARETYRDDLEWQLRNLTEGAMRHICEKGDVEACVEHWIEQQQLLVERWRNMVAELHATEVMISPYTPLLFASCWIWHRAVCTVKLLRYCIFAEC